MANELDLQHLLGEHVAHLKIPSRMFVRKGPDESYVGAVPTVAGVLFFNGGYTPEAKAAICDCFDDFKAFASEHLQWLMLDEPPKGPDRYKYAKAPELRAMLESLDEDNGLGFLFHSGEQADDAGEWTFEVYGRRAWEAKMGGYGPDSLRFSLPLLFVHDNLAAFQSLFVKFADRLKALHGYGGHALMLSATKRYANESFEAWFVPKAHGYDAGHPLHVSDYLVEKMKTVSWLTAVNHDFVKEVGGVYELQSMLPRDWFALYEYSNGLVIQAGPKPNQCGVEIDPKPATYVLPYMLFKPVIADNIKGFHGASVNGEPKMNEAEANDWMERFDVPEVEVMAYRTKLLSEPKLTKEATLCTRL
jgi:hypothetical protein